MQLKQYNGFIVRLPAQGAGGVFNGRATLSTYGPDWVRPYSGGLAMGTYDMYGWLLLTIHWDGGSAGGYHLLIYPDGRVWGTTWNILRGNGADSEYLFTLVFPDPVGEDAVAAQMAVVEAELRTVRELVEGDR